MNPITDEDKHPLKLNPIANNVNDVQDDQSVFDDDDAECSVDIESLHLLSNVCFVYLEASSYNITVYNYIHNRCNCLLYGLAMVM